MNAARIGLTLFAVALTAGCDTNPGGPSATATPAPSSTATVAPADAGGAPEAGGRRQMGGRTSKAKTGSQPATAD